MKVKAKAMIIIALLLMMAVHVYGQEKKTVTYIDHYWDENTKTLVPQIKEREAEVRRANSTVHLTNVPILGVEGEERWYYLDDISNKSLYFHAELGINGKVHVIVRDGLTWRVENGINLPKGSELHIYAHSFDCKGLFRRKKKTAFF